MGSSIKSLPYYLCPWPSDLWRLTYLLFSLLYSLLPIKSSLCLLTYTVWIQFSSIDPMVFVNFHLNSSQCSLLFSFFCLTSSIYHLTSPFFPLRSEICDRLSLLSPLHSDLDPFTSALVLLPSTVSLPFRINPSVTCRLRPVTWRLYYYDSVCRLPSASVLRPPMSFHLPYTSSLMFSVCTIIIPLAVQLRLYLVCSLPSSVHLLLSYIFTLTYVFLPLHLKIYPVFLTIYTLVPLPSYHFVDKRAIADSCDKGRGDIRNGDDGYIEDGDPEITNDEGSYEDGDAERTKDDEGNGRDGNDQDAEDELVTAISGGRRRVGRDGRLERQWQIANGKGSIMGR